MLRRYHSDTQSMKIAQGVSGTVKDKGSAQRNIPFLMQAARQGFQVGWASNCHLTLTDAICTKQPTHGAQLRLLIIVRAHDNLTGAFAQDLGARSIAAAHEMLASGSLYLETRTGAAQAEGNVHDMYSYDKVRW